MVKMSCFEVEAAKVPAVSGDGVGVAQLSPPLKSAASAGNCGKLSEEATVPRSNSPDANLRILRPRREKTGLKLQAILEKGKAS